MPVYGDILMEKLSFQWENVDEIILHTKRDDYQTHSHTHNEIAKAQAHRFSCGPSASRKKYAICKK
jgi:hypothetical protein